MNEWGRKYLKKLDEPEEIRWLGKSYNVTHTLTLGKKTYYIVKDLSGKRERYMAFDRWSQNRGEMWCILGIDGKNLDARNKNRQPGLVEKLKRLSGNDGRLPVIFSYDRIGRERAYLVTSWTEGEDLGCYLERVKNGNHCEHEGNRCIQKKLICAKKRETGMKCEPRPSAYEVCLLMISLAHGLRQLHRLNIVHGDLNPRNLILQRNPNRLVMIDFGSAWLVEHTLNRDLGDGNRPKYAAPELLAKDSEQCFADDRSDQFSFGVIWYELLTLKYPYGGYGGDFRRLNQQEIITAEQAYQPPSQAASILNIDKNRLPLEAWHLVDRIIGRCLARDPDKRYQRERDLLDDVDELRHVMRAKKLSTRNEEFLKTFEKPV
ncbi:serine/threonine protein kinase [Leptolyngbya sp. AN02str]|uniref:serine/threonine protein kinase n=1 Tax=Leptolyngbya sp. AN02str TaxID=3423363 RepID=UPI003D31C968